MSGWCKHCGEYDVWGRGCDCRVIGTVWRADDDEECAWELYGKSSETVADAIERFVKKKHTEDFEFTKYDATEAFSFRPIDGGPIQYVTVSCELVPSYRASEADKDDDDVSSARRRRARTLMYRRNRSRAVVSRNL